LFALAGAHESWAGDGAYFLLTEPAARPVAAGGAFTAVRGGLDSLLYNPAALDKLDYLQASFSHLEAYGDWQHEWVALGLPALGSSFAASLLMSHLVPFTLYDNNGNPAGTATAGSQVFGLHWAKSVWLPKLTLGASLKGFSSQLAEYSNLGGAVDLGVLYQAVDDMTVGASLQNLGMQTAYLSDADSLPLRLRLGMAWGIYQSQNLNFNLSNDLVAFRDPAVPYQWHSGGEFNINRIFYLDGGTRLDASTFQYALGLGLDTSYFRMSYAYAPGVVLGIAHRVSLDFHPPH
jgi:hypothetical protein